MSQPYKGFVKKEVNPYPINDEIRAFKVLLLDEEGNKIGVFSKFDAIAKAAEESKDVIQVGFNPNDNIATAKLMDYGKFMYNQKKDDTQKKKTKKSKGVKEVKFGYNIGENDLELKIKKAKEFFDEGYGVKFVAFVRGREMVYKDKMLTRLENILKDLEDVAKGQGIKEERNGYSAILFAKNK